MPHTPPVDLWGRRVTEARRRKGLTQTDLARATRVHPATISRLEGGVHRPSDVLRIAIAKALDVPAAELFPYEDAA